MHEPTDEKSARNLKIIKVIASKAGYYMQRTGVELPIPKQEIAVF